MGSITVFPRIPSETKSQKDIWAWQQLCSFGGVIDGFNGWEVSQRMIENESAERLPVLTKTDFVKRYKTGEFGNASPTWNNLEDWGDQSDHPTDSLFHIRNRVAGGLTWYDLDPWETVEVWNQLVNGDTFGPVDPASLYISAMAPTPLTLFQGEVMRTHRGLELFYSCQRKTMREALALDGKQLYGSQAQRLIDHFLPPMDHEWLMGLLERYPDHVVEFSRYEKKFGTVPGFHTVYWEVRKY